MNIKYELFKKSIKGKSVAVLGIGVSNMPLIRLLHNCGAIITACDKKSKEKLGEVYNELASMKAELRLGEGYLENLNQDIIFKTPGIHPYIPQLIRAKQRGAVITSEMEVFFDLCPAQIIAVTGSDGKTTTTTLIYKMLCEQGYRCHLGGNIGRPLLGDIEKIKPEDKVVLELSSFQLHTMKTSPQIAVITNITPNHLDMHKSMEEYVQAKKNVFLHQSVAGRLVLNYDNEITRSFYTEAIGEAMFFSRVNAIDEGIRLNNNNIELIRGGKAHNIMNTSDILLPGVHNIENYMAAIGAVWDMVDIAVIKRIASSFSGVEHRIEPVREISGIRFYNDSIASSPTRTIAGLKSFNQKLIIIAGGYDKELPFDELGLMFKEHVKHLILIGKTAKKIKAAVQNAYEKGQRTMPIEKALSLEEAVNKAYSAAQKGDIIMLSPACASFDMFANFEERGNKFKAIVNGLK